jgi:NitT/TauT family transport system substrate-binding protein
MTLTRRAMLIGTLAAPAIISRANAGEAVTYLFPGPQFLPAFAPHQLALKRGYFTAAGLDVTFQTARGGADGAKQVAVGNADMGGGVGETTMIVRPNGLAVRGVALLGGKPLYQIACRKAASIKTLADLKGRKIGVISYQDTGYYTLLGALAAVGLHKGDLEIQSVGPAGMTQLMIAGSLDAITAVPEWSVTLEAANVGLDFFPIDAAFPSMAQALFTSDDIIKKRPAMVRGFVAAVMHALNDCITDPKAAAEEYVTAVPQQAGKAVEIETILRRYGKDVYPTIPPAVPGHFSAEQLAKVQNFYVENAIIPHAVPVEDLYTNDFVG